MPLRAKEYPEFGKVLASWDFSEYLKHERRPGWFVWASILFLLLFTYAAIEQNYLFAILLVLFSMITIVHHANDPPLLTIDITQDGILIDEKFYPYTEIQSFAILYQPPAVKLVYFTFQHKLRPPMRIPLQNMDPVHIRGILLNALYEDTSIEEETATEAFGRIFKI